MYVYVRIYQCVLRALILHECFWSLRCAHQEGGAGDSEGLFVEVGAAKQQQDIVVVFCLVELQRLR